MAFNITTFYAEACSYQAFYEFQTDRLLKIAQKKMTVALGNTKPEK